MTTMVVTRLPGAPPRRAGRTWPDGQPVVLTEWTAAMRVGLTADPGYRVELHDAPPEQEPTHGPQEETRPAAPPAPVTPPRKRPSKAR